MVATNKMPFIRVSRAGFACGHRPAMAAVTCSNQPIKWRVCYSDFPTGFDTTLLIGQYFSLTQVMISKKILYFFSLLRSNSADPKYRVMRRFILVCTGCQCTCLGVG